MKKTFSFLLLLVVCVFKLSAQTISSSKSDTSNIHELKLLITHYKELQKLHLKDKNPEIYMGLERSIKQKEAALATTIQLYNSFKTNKK